MPKNNTMKHFFLLLVVVSLFLSCKKERIRKAVAGTWTIDKLQTTFYTNGKQDSAITYLNAGAFILKDNGGSLYNDCHFKFGNGKTYAIYLLPQWGGTKEGFDCYWETDPTTEDRITFSNTSIYTASPFFIFTRQNRTSKSEEWVYVAADSKGNMSLREIYYVSHSD